MSGRPRKPCESCLEWKARYDGLLERYQRLVESMVEMKTPSQMVIEPPKFVNLPPEVEAALGEVSEPNTPVDRHLRALAMQRQALGDDPANIAEFILAGEEIV